VVVSTRIDAQYAGYESGQGEMQFSCRFRAMRYAHVFRPDRSTPKPVIAGPQTAVVVGPGGEEIYTDEHGRVKVQFHWDRLGTKDDKSSCWVRVASPWAGKAWGMISLPRIGQEVVVDFLEGDPDLPLITGRVYNAEQIPPYKLPEQQDHQHHQEPAPASAALPPTSTSWPSRTRSAASGSACMPRRT
jgi:type VI secretion system secreted protein VgrG